MLQRMILGIALIALFDSSCEKNKISSPISKNPKEKISASISSCLVPESFSAAVPKVVATNDNFYYGLLHYQKILGGAKASTLFSCDLRDKKFNPIIEGNEKSQIIDFTVTPTGKIFALLSNSSGLEPKSDELPPEYFRELEIINVSNKMSLGVFNDPDFKNGFQYDATGAVTPSLPKVQGRTLLHSQYSTMFIAEIYSSKYSLYLTYVGTGGYRVANVSIDGKVLATSVIMPNTTQNDVIFSRFPPKFFVRDNFLFSLVPIYKEDVIAYNKHFNRQLKNSISSERGQLLLTQWNNDLTFKDHMIITE